MPVIVEKRLVKAMFPEFAGVEEQTKADAMSLAKEQWGLDYGGMLPKDNQYGETPIRLPYFNLGTTHGTAETWNRNFTATGWQALINNKKTIEDVILGITGWELASATKKLAGIYQKYGDRTLPVEIFETEVQLYEMPQLLFETGITVNEETTVDVDVLVTATGYQMIRPLGFAFVKKPLLIQKKPV